MNSQDSARILSILHGAYPHVAIDDPIASVWANALEGDEFQVTLTAVQEWIGSQRYWPTVAEMRVIVRRLQGRVDERRSLPPGPPDTADVNAAKAAFSAGYRRERTKQNDSDEVIEAKLERYMRNFPGSVLGR